MSLSCIRILCLTTFSLLTGSLTHASAAPAAPVRTALVIGNAKYEAAVGPLRNTVNDAKAMAKTLRGLGFAVIEEHNLDRDDLLKAVLKFRTTLPGAEVGLFYYAGHGISVGGSNYLLPLKSGYSPDGADDVTLRMLAETRLFNVEQAVADMKAAGARCNLVILDACRTTAVARTGRTRDVAEAGGLAEMKPPAGSLIAFATDAGQTALDGDGTNGLYTEELLKNLRTPGLSIEQVFKRTRAGVLERSQGGQIPAEYSRLIGEDIFLAGPIVSPETPSPASAPTTPPQPAVPAQPELAMVREARPATTLPPVIAPPPPTIAQLNKLAATGKAEECVQGLQRLAESRGPGGYAVAPLETLLEQVKDDLKILKAGSPKVAETLLTCELVIQALRDCLPPDHPDKPLFTAKAQSRKGDCQMLMDRAADALASYNAALSLTPEDAYMLYNRGHACQVLGDFEKAKADFTKVIESKTAQPGARRLASAALAKLPGQSQSTHLDPPG